MKIAHIGNVAGVGSILARYQKRVGHDTAVFCFDKNTENLFGGKLVDWNGGNKFTRLMTKKRFFGELENYDIWHYHYPYGGLKEALEEHRKKRKYIKHYHGDDLRGKYEDDFCLLSTPDLLRYAPNGVWLPNPIDLDEMASISVDSKNSEVIRLAHYPFYKVYDRENHYNFGELKGCQIVEILNMPHKQVLESIASCDIVIGKILPDMGWFSKFELEGMALGKPVITYVSNDLYEMYRPPIYRTTKETFADDLLSLINNIHEQQRLAGLAREYIKENHDAVKIAHRVEECYQRV